MPSDDWQHLANEWIHALRHAGRAPGTLALYQRTALLFAQRGVDAVLPLTLAPSTRRQRYDVLHAFLIWCDRSGARPGAPGLLAAVPIPHSPEPPPRAVPADALTRITDQVRRLPLKWRTYFTLVLETGMRSGEAVRIRVRDIDLSTLGRESVRVLGKGGRERIIPLPAGFASRPLLKRLIRERIAPDAFLFSKSRTGDMPMTTAAARYQWARVLKAAGVAGYSIHSLRHTVATRLVERVGDLSLAQRLLGHASLRTTARYTVRGEAALRKAMEQSAL